MTRLHRNVNLAAVVLPFAAFLVAIALLWNSLIGWTDLVILFALYMLSGLGITVGFHRLLTHRAFETYRPIKYLFAVLGTVAVQGPVIGWVADHRKHHAFTDEEGDPHSPMSATAAAPAGAGRFAAFGTPMWAVRVRLRARREAIRARSARGSRHGLDQPPLPADRRRRAGRGLRPRLRADRNARRALTALLWGGFVRIFFLHHVTWSINSICHFFGRRRFRTEDRSTNVFWLAPISFGESWYHNHHAFPRSAWHGLRWWELDVGGWLIAAMKRLHLAWNVVRIAPERQAQKLAATLPLERIAQQGQ